MKLLIFETAVMLSLMRHFNKKFTNVNIQFISS